MRRIMLVALLVAAPLFALGSTPAAAGGWCRGSYGYSYSPYYHYRPYYRPRVRFGGYFYRPRAWGWRGYGYRRGWRGRRWGWRGRRW